MDEIQSQLSNLGYDSAASELHLNDGPPINAFVEIVSWLSSQLVPLCQLECHVSLITSDEDLLGFLVEVSSLLKEICCPYKNLTQGPIKDRLSKADDKIHVITYLITELEAAKIQTVKKPKKKDVPMQIELEESQTAKELRETLMCLRFSKPPETITPNQLFGELEKKLKFISQPVTPKDKIGDLLFSGYLTEKQWFQLEYLYKEMYTEYKTRRNLLLTRLNVTVQSFLWSDRLKKKSEEVMDTFNKRKSGISPEPFVKIFHILAAKSDLAVIDKTSSANVRKNTKSAIYKEIIGAVPDRGGRPEEQQPPPPEVPSWQKNDSSNRGGSRPQSQQSFGSYKNANYSQNENSNPRDNYRSDNASRGNFRGGRNDFYTSHPPQQQTPIYQPVNVGYVQPYGDQQFGFGGYKPAGDNFQQYGMSDGMNQYQSNQEGRGGYRGSGGGQYRGGNSDRGFRSRGRPRGGRQY